MDALLEQIGGIVATVLDNPLVRAAMFGFVAYVVLVWLASAWWAFHDLRRRHGDPALPYVAAGAVVLASPVLFPLAVIIYRIVRPSETLAEARERELSERLEALETEMALGCPGCRRSVEEDWLVCPACRTRLAHRCLSCGRTMGLDWTLCGWCGTDFGRTVLPERLAIPAARAHPGERRARARLAGAKRALESGA